MEAHFRHFFWKQQQKMQVVLEMGNSQKYLLLISKCFDPREKAKIIIIITIKFNRWSRGTSFIYQQLQASGKQHSYVWLQHKCRMATIITDRETLGQLWETDGHGSTCALPFEMAHICRLWAKLYDIKTGTINISLTAYVSRAAKTACSEKWYGSKPSAFSLGFEGLRSSSKTATILNPRQMYSLNWFPFSLNSSAIWANVFLLSCYIVV